MNRPTKLLLVVVGIMASIGFWNQLSTKPLIVHLPVPTPDPFICVCPPVITITATPSPAPKIHPGDQRIVCKKCGEEYGVPRVCNLGGGLFKQEIQHQHLSPKQKAEAIRDARLKWHEMAVLGRSLPPSERRRLLQRVHEALEDEIEAYR